MWRNYFYPFFFASQKKRNKKEPGNDIQPIAGSRYVEHLCKVDWALGILSCAQLLFDTTQFHKRVSKDGPQKKLRLENDKEEEISVTQVGYTF